MRIVIERGHGPHDPGAIGPTGLTEYEVTKNVCRRLGYLDYEVKGRDRKLSTLLWQLRFNRPDVLVSIHCNAGSLTKHECHVYHWRDEPNVPKLQNSMALASSIANRALGRYAENAGVFWFPMLRQVKRKSKKFTPGLMKWTAKLAAVTVELGFISDGHVEARMKTELWRESAALGVHLGIQDWLASYSG
jgi:N-acetylmuramoyl-L-alanine amidase